MLAFVLRRVLQSAAVMAVVAFIAFGLFLALAVGIPLRVYTALRRTGWLSQFLLAASLVGVSLPTFLIGILLILVFAVLLGWLPSFGRGDTVAFGWWTTGLLTKGGPGMGLLFIQAINFADIPIMAAYLCLTAIVFVFINLVVDLMYHAVDPRLRAERDGAH